MTKKTSSFAFVAGLGALGLGLAVTGGSAAHAQSTSSFPFYHLTKTIPVHSTGSSWDYIKFDPSGNRLFVGHRLDGVEVFDIAHGFKMSKVPDTSGANGVVLAPHFGVGIAADNDGYLTEFKLSNLQEVRKIKVGAALDSAVYDPVTHQVVTVNVNTTKDGKGQVLGVYKLPSLKKTASVTVPATDLEHSVADNRGNIYFAGQDVNAILRLDMKTLKITANYPTPGCTQPTGLDLDTKTNRLMIACRGHLTKPVFEVMNADTGAIVYKAPITPGNDGVAFDPKNNDIFVTDGIGANMFIFKEQSADKYKLDEIVDTSTNQRTLAVDPKTSKIYTIAAEGTVDPAQKILTQVSPFYPNVFTPNTFKIYQYGK